MGSATKTYSGGVVNSVSNYRKRLYSQKYEDGKPDKSDQEAVEEMLWEYKSPDCTKERKDQLRHDILMRLYFLLPHYLKKNYHFTAELFNDAIQNMTVNTLQAIELFKPELGFPFTNYLIGYFKDAATKTLRSCNVVSTATLRQAAIDAGLPQDEVENAKNPYIVSGEGDDEEQDNADLTAPETTKVNDDEEDHSSDLDAPIHEHQMVIQGAMSVHGNAVELDDNRIYALAPGMENEIDMDERMHAEQLLVWLGHAMSEEAGILTPDERMVLMHLYGLFGAPKMKYAEIAAIRGATGKGCACSRISQINTAAIKKIREYFYDYMIEP